MSGKEEAAQVLAAKFAVIFPHLDERQRRLLLAARAPRLRQAVREAKKAGWAYVVLDGTLIPVDRVAADLLFYSRQVQEARDEPAGHRQPLRRHPVGVGGAAGFGP